jgi:hypothetical protein
VVRYIEGERIEHDPATEALDETARAVHALLD